MSDFDYKEVMRLMGWVKVVEDTLPAGPGVRDDEVGKPGPWVGWKCKDTGEVYGWETGDEGVGGALMVLGERVGWQNVAVVLWEALERCKRIDRFVHAVAMGSLEKVNKR